MNDIFVNNYMNLLSIVVGNRWGLTAFNRDTPQMLFFHTICSIRIELSVIANEIASVK